MNATLKQQRNRRYDARRREEQPWRDLYDKAKWRNKDYGLRAQQLRKQPLCERCKSKGKTVSATEVHHRTKHNGDPAIFFDASILESTCKTCHDSYYHQVEMLGYSTEVGSNGMPTDPSHPWYKGS